MDRRNAYDDDEEYEYEYGDKEGGSGWGRRASGSSRPHQQQRRQRPRSPPRSRSPSPARSAHHHHHRRDRERDRDYAAPAERGGGGGGGGAWGWRSSRDHGWGASAPSSSRRDNYPPDRGFPPPRRGAPPPPDRRWGPSASARSRTEAESDPHAISTRAVDDAIEDGRAVLVHGLTQAVLRTHLAHIFRPYGDVLGIELPVFKTSGQNRGRAVVVFASTRAASKAVSHMHAGLIDGQVVHVKQPDPPAPHSSSHHKSPRR
ncbi:hypothetical protein OC842_005334 [Tilletia horrida]|uniref:RRM domain-containing protein n=1 Tax=Tilletia horrida TaxID=155126 RepID=A0AAN6JJ52_9BASI|nr:hypothetical protein OC842_005334 [Tilletia horrida]